jgi:hypothetical protein
LQGVYWGSCWFSTRRAKDGEMEPSLNRDGDMRFNHERAALIAFVNGICCEAASLEEFSAHSGTGERRSKRPLARGEARPPSPSARLGLAPRRPAALAHSPDRPLACPPRRRTAQSPAPPCAGPPARPPARPLPRRPPGPLAPAGPPTPRVPRAHIPTRPPRRRPSRDHCMMTETEALGAV